MSFGSILGGIGKAVLGVAKTGVNVATTVVGIGPVIPTNGGAKQAAVASISPAIRDGNPQGTAAPSLWPALLGSATDALSGLGNWLNGRTHTQNDVNIGSGGRADNLTQPTSTPSWLIPAGIAGALLLIFSGGQKRRRY